MPRPETRSDTLEPLEEQVEAPLLIALATAAPALVWLAAAAVVLVAALGGYRALAILLDLTLPEAAALRDQAEVLRQIRHGTDPNEADRVRRGVIRDEEYLLTPLVAAAVNRHGGIVRLLVDNGAKLNDTNFAVLYCIALVKAADIVPFLMEHAPVGAPADCESISLPLPL